MHPCQEAYATLYITFGEGVFLLSLGSASGLHTRHFLGFSQALAFPTRYNVPYISKKLVCCALTTLHSTYITMNQSIASLSCYH